MTTPFGADYGQARALFLDAARQQGAGVESVLHPERGPDGAELFTDVALLGDRDAENVLVLISATHGVEGFCGSGAQVDWLRREEGKRLAGNTAALLIHAVNPYGFAWLRRVTEDNVDLNRNWVDFSKPLPENPDYDSLQAAFVPKSWSDAARAEANAAIMAFVQARGFPALTQAMSGGQYTDPLGLWFGGHQPTWSRRTQTKIFEAYLGHASRVAIVDYHTGIGPSGYAEPISTFPSASGAYQRARAWYGLNVVSMPDGASSSAILSGDGLSAAPALLPKAEVTPIAMEYGTVSPIEVSEALRADAWLHAYGDPLSPDAKPIKRQIRDAFYTDTDEWRGMVLGQSLQTARKAAFALGQPL